jgi:Ribbon-helix-helix protein, copG family
MARSQNTGTVVHAWLRPEFAREVKELADRDGRSVSNLIKIALRDRLEDFATATVKPSAPAAGLSRAAQSRSGAGLEEEGDG